MYLFKSSDIYRKGCVSFLTGMFKAYCSRRNSHYEDKRKHHFHGSRLKL